VSVEDYDGQKRGDGAAYERYLAGMDASMRQKVALTAAHLLCQGDIADMGMGSGSGSYALASLYPDLQVIGVDVNPEMVARAAKTHVLPNLRFVTGDIAKRCFDAMELEAILNSSVLHHVTSFNDYSVQAAVDALAVQREQLADEGILIVRDFLRPESPDAPVVLELPNDGPAALLERFSRQFRLLSEDRRGFPLSELEPAVDGWRRFQLTSQHAVEFVLRKDYLRDWDLEVKEEYTYLTQTRFEQVFSELGLRVLASTPIRNPWIVRNRFVGCFRWFDAASGCALDWPATNYVIVGQRVADGLGVRFEPRANRPPRGYLQLSHWRRDDGALYDVVRRPGATADVVPWFVAPATGAVHVMARRSYPRPILAAAPTSTLDGGRAPHYITEPLVILVGDKPLAQTAEERLAEFPSLQPDQLKRFQAGAPYYPSPGGIQEQVRPLFVEVAPTNAQQSLARAKPWSTWGTLRSIEARQLLRASQVGGLPDARLELNVYDLLLRLGRALGPWIGEGLDPSRGSVQVTQPEAFVDVATAAPRRRFRRSQRGPGAPERFLDLKRQRFAERTADGAIAGEGELEYVVPLPLSAQTVVAAVIARDADGLPVLGIDDDDLPAAQCFTGHSNLPVAPAWRLPHGVDSWLAMEAFVRTRFTAEYGAQVAHIATLGGRYHPSPGCTPEVVYPLAVQLDGWAPESTHRRLRWVRLADAITNRAMLSDGHLRIVALRAYHALYAGDRSTLPT